MFLGLVISCQARNRPVNQEPEQSSSHRGIRAGLIILGVLFTIGWIGACAFYGLVTLLASAMSPPEPGNHLTDGLIGNLVFFGIVTTAIAGIPGGAAFYCRRHRVRYILLWFGLLVAGVFIVFCSSVEYFGPQWV